MNHDLRIQNTPTLNALRVRKSRLKKDPSIRHSTVSAVRAIKYLPEYGGAIKEFGSDPLTVIFWNDYQMFLFNQIRKRQRVRLSIDATGSLIKNSSLISDLHHMFLCT